MRTERGQQRPKKMGEGESVDICIYMRTVRKVEREFRAGQRGDQVTVR